MQSTLRGLVIAALLMLVFGVPIAAAQSSLVIDDQGVTMEFPNRMTFRANVESNTPIAQVVLEYGVERLTCGTVTAKVFPEFTPGTTADVTWTWEMLQSGSEPPGAQVWYRWRVTDTEGNEEVTETETVTWLDDQHDWEALSSGMLTLHWYEGTDDFAQELLDSAVASMEQLTETTGVTPESPVNLYIYGDNTDMRDAVLYEPGWTGGQAYPAYDIVIIGISPEDLDWGKDTIAHELTHVLVGHLTFSCLGSVPTWLNEGIAVYGEGGLDPLSADRLNAAIAANELISVRALSGGFSEHPDKADLSYSQSYSLVNFLIGRYGAEKLLALFGTLRDGMPIEAGLQATYGFGLDGLEDQWRTEVGATARQTGDATPTPTPEPSPIPTYQPIAAVPIAPTRAATATPTVAVPTATPIAAAAAEPAAAEPAEPAEPAGVTDQRTIAPIETVWPRVLALGIIAVVIFLSLALVAGIALIRESRRAKAKPQE